MTTQLGWTEKWTLRFAVVALLFLALSGFEGMLMRTQLYDINALHGMEAALNLSVQAFRTRRRRSSTIRC